MSNEPKGTRPFRIGILGGLGPDAGVHLQHLIIRATPARTDQEHLQVITFTNPLIPARTESLKRDDGASYIAPTVESLHLLEDANVDVLVIACVTAHARLARIREQIRTPILDIAKLTRREIGRADGTVGILATTGTIDTGLFSLPSAQGKTMACPPIMDVIHAIKAGVRGPSITDPLIRIIRDMQSAGCVKFVLGCTELPLVHDELAREVGEIFIDPLRLAAAELVRMAGR